MTFPLSQLPANAQAFHAQYANTGLVTFVKHIEGAGVWRMTAAMFGDMDDMLSLGWLVINAKA